MPQEEATFDVSFNPIQNQCGNAAKKFRNLDLNLGELL